MKITPEIARIHAHVCGDGYVYKSKERRSPKSLITHKRKNIELIVWTMAYSNTCEVLIKQFQEDIKTSFKRNACYAKTKKEARVRGAKHIINDLELENKNSYNWSIPNFIKNSPKNIIANWIQAFFDDEAYVDLKKKAILVETVNKDGMFDIKEILNTIGMDCELYHLKSKGTWRLCLYRENVLKYSKLVSFSHPDKKDKLEKIAEIRKNMGWVGIS